MSTLYLVLIPFVWLSWNKEHISLHLLLSQVYLGANILDTADTVIAAVAVWFQAIDQIRQLHFLQRYLNLWHYPLLLQAGLSWVLLWASLLCL